MNLPKKKDELMELATLIEQVYELLNAGNTVSEICEETGESASVINNCVDIIEEVKKRNKVHEK